jgi:hypothetical protein
MRPRASKIGCDPPRERCSCCRDSEYMHLMKRALSGVTKHRPTKKGGIKEYNRLTSTELSSMQTSLDVATGDGGPLDGPGISRVDAGEVSPLGGERTGHSRAR